MSSVLLYFEIDVSSVLTRISEYNIMSTLCLHKYAGLDKKHKLLVITQRTPRRPTHKSGQMIG